MPKTHNQTKHPKAATPMSDELERARIALGQVRTPAYGDALRLCRRLERQLHVEQAKQPRAGAR